MLHKPSNAAQGFDRSLFGLEGYPPYRFDIVSDDGVRVELPDRKFNVLRCFHLQSIRAYPRARRREESQNVARANVVWYLK